MATTAAMLRAAAVLRWMIFMGSASIMTRYSTHPTNYLATAYVIPGVNPHSFRAGEIVKLNVNKLTSTKTLLPIDYYQLPYCYPLEGVKLDNQNLGQIVSGDKIESSPYLIKMKTDMYCEQLCVSNLGRADQRHVTPNRFVKAIRHQYHNNWIVDNLPSAWKQDSSDVTQTRYGQGFPIGFISETDHKAYVYNHVNIVIEYHAVEEGMTGSYRIVRFTVEPFSIAHELEGPFMDPIDADRETKNHLPLQTKINNPIPSCDPKMTESEHTIYEMIVDNEVKPQPASGDVLFTYDVIWTENPELRWASRWDVYLSMNDAIPTKAHWLSMVNNMVIVFVSSALIVSTLSAFSFSTLSTIQRGSSTNPYDDLLLADVAEDDDTIEEFGWQAVRSDVFRPPTFSPGLLAVGCGSGAQLLCATIVTVFLTYLGFLKAPRRGHLVLAQLLISVIFGFINGYVTARFYKAFDGKEQHRTTTIAAFGLSGIAFVFFMLIYFISWVKGSTYAIPVTTVFVLVILWVGISVPLVFLGARIGYAQKAIESPVSTSSIPREIPKQPKYTGSPIISVGLSGILPMIICYVELYFIMSSAWLGIYYDDYGYLLIVIMLVLVVVTAQAVLLTYYQLCNEDYHWWWRAFWNGGSVAMYIFVHSMIYFRQLETQSLASFILYHGYMGLVSLSIFSMLGFVGVSSSLLFNIFLYTSIKTE